MQTAELNHYAVLGLDRDCSAAHIRAAYRLLAKQHHPDVNPGSTAAKTRTQALNAAYEILSDPGQRRTYDQQLDSQKAKSPRATASRQRNVSQDVQLRIEEFLRGTALQVRVMDSADERDAEIYDLTVPPETAPGTRFRIARSGGGFVTVKTRARPDFRFKIRGSDLRCDLRINFQRAQKGGMETVRGVTGNFLHVPIPPRVARGETIRIPGEGLPKARGGRGDLLVRITYQPQVQITRSSKR